MTIARAARSASRSIRNSCGLQPRVGEEPRDLNGAVLIRLQDAELMERELRKRLEAFDPKARAEFPR